MQITIKHVKDSNEYRKPKALRRPMWTIAFPYSPAVYPTAHATAFRYRKTQSPSRGDVSDLFSAATDISLQRFQIPQEPPSAVGKCEGPLRELQHPQKPFGVIGTLLTDSRQPDYSAQSGHSLTKTWLSKCHLANSYRAGCSRPVSLPPGIPLGQLMCLLVGLWFGPLWFIYFFLN